MEQRLSIHPTTEQGFATEPEKVEDKRTEPLLSEEEVAAIRRDAVEDGLDPDVAEAKMRRLFAEIENDPEQRRRFLEGTERARKLIEHETQQLREHLRNQDR